MKCFDYLLTMVVVIAICWLLDGHTFYAWTETGIHILIKYK